MAHERLLNLSKHFHLTSSAMSEQRKVVPLDQCWVFKQKDGSDSAQVLRPTAMFPTNIHLDLLTNDIIPNPFSGTNEKDVQWVGDQVWVYQCSFTVPLNEIDKFQFASLHFEGLDTFAVVTLDGHEILRSDNMFVSNRVDVGDLLRGKESHVLELVFESATRMGQLEMNEHPKHAWGAWNGDPSRTAVRKAQYHYVSFASLAHFNSKANMVEQGWDWGPKLMTCGPWKPIYLELYTSQISDLSFSTIISEDLQTAKILVSAEIEGSATAIRIELFHDGARITEVSLEEVSGIAKTELAIQSPQLWWPFTHGKQPLYTLKATLHGSPNPKSGNATILDVARKKLGIRKVELIQRPLANDDGATFFFQINNIPMFITGACWIPGDSFTPRITAKSYRDWISLAKTANQSMIRVWGGGIYEPDAFYDLCDELGVLVWQDFMFACGNYPAYPKMLRSIETEARQNVKRLRHHPSIAIWAGNNEDYLYQALAGLHYDADDKDPQSWLKTNFPARYIYEHLLQNVCEELTPETPYHPGSPFGGAIAVDPTTGDIHQWSVWHLEKQPYQDYDQLGGRFVSEFGMQGFPFRRTVEEYFDDATSHDEKTAGNAAIEWHNKATGAADTLKKYDTSYI